MTGCGNNKVPVDDNGTVKADIVKPVITIKGDAQVTLTVGDTYTEAGASATDDVDGTVAVKTTGSVDTTKAGTYTITYTATDKAGNKSTATRTVIVEDKECQNVNPITGGCEDVTECQNVNPINGQCEDK